MMTWHTLITNNAMFHCMTLCIITSAKEDMYCSCLSVWLSVSISNFVQTLQNGFAWNFQERLTIGKWTKDQILVAVRIADPDCETDKTCLGGGMHCPSASSSECIFWASQSWKRGTHATKKVHSAKKSGNQWFTDKPCFYSNWEFGRFNVPLFIDKFPQFSFLRLP